MTRWDVGAPNLLVSASGPFRLPVAPARRALSSACCLPPPTPGGPPRALALWLPGHGRKQKRNDHRLGSKRRRRGS
eukprot:4512602-Pyramimonas_sp.AAC.1